MHYSFLYLNKYRVSYYWDLDYLIQYILFEIIFYLIFFSDIIIDTFLVMAILSYPRCHMHIRVAVSISVQFRNGIAVLWPDSSSSNSLGLGFI